MVGQRPWIIICMINRSGVPRFWCLADTRRTLINHLGIIEVNRVVCRPSVFSDIRTSCVRLHIPHMFFSSGFKASTSLAYITPWAVSTRYFVNHVRLQINRRSGLGRGKLLLQCLEWLIDNSDIMSGFLESSKRLGNSINIRKNCIVKEIERCGPFEKHADKCWDGVCSLSRRFLL